MQTTRVRSKADLRIEILISRKPALARNTAEKLARKAVNFCGILSIPFPLRAPFVLLHLAANCF
jgi:hypothetical protein